MSYVAGNTFGATNIFLQSLRFSFLEEVSFYGNVFRFPCVVGVLDCRRAPRRNRAGRHKRHWSRSLHIYIRLQARQPAYRCHVDDFGGRHVRRLSADFGRLNRHAQVRGKISAQQSQTRHDTCAADDVVFNSLVRHGSRRLHDVPDYLRHCD